ncbi:MAG: YfhO family protein [Candidatus Nitrohelix vancouverensis]|uniref:YfhO family protein n=1 Tax=Candidatus Nitrohelix vancouverensis TaxID=2705534 RepID=A0A7T0C1R3_9BACT|nr:MAG: YfhO family protein [Candidatus Nitrohelix vancouverensis]
MTPARATSPTFGKTQAIVWGLGDLAAMSVLALAWLLYFLPVLFQDLSLFFRDIPVFAYPMKHFIWEALQEGFMPFWWPAIHSGVPFLSLWHPGVLYPLNLIFVWDDFTSAFNVFVTSHFLIGSLFTYLFCRSSGQSMFAALGAGCVAMWGGFFLSVSPMQNHFQAAVWLPAMLFCAERFFQRGGVGPALGVILALALQILAGSPEFFLLSVFLLLLYALWMHGRERRIRRALQALTATLLGLGLSALQWIPAGFLAPHSDRASGLDFETATRWSMKPETLLSLLVPLDVSGFMQNPVFRSDYFLLSPYMGWFSLFVLLFAFWRTEDRKAHFWICILALGLLFSLGKHNPAYRLMYDALPLLDGFRYPEKFFFLSAYALVFLTGFGLDAIARLSRTMTAKGLMLVGIGFVLLILAVGAYDAQRPTGWILFSIAATGLFIALHRKDIWDACLLKGGLVALIAFDLLLNNGPLVPLIHKNFFESPPEALQAHPPSAENYRYYSGPLLTEEILPTKNSFPRESNLLRGYLAMKAQAYPNLGTVHGLNYIDGLTGWGLHDSELWTLIFTRSPPDKRRRMLERGNVRFWISPELGEAPTSAHPFGLPERVELERALPRAFMVSKARSGGDPKASNVYFSESFDPLREVLLGEPFAQTETSGSPFEGEAVSVTYAPNRVFVQTRQSQAGYLVLLDSYFPGWSARVDGTFIPVLRANYFYRAVFLPPGEHRVEFSYQPEGWGAGLMLSLSTLMLVFMALLIPEARRRIVCRPSFPPLI